MTNKPSMILFGSPEISPKEKDISECEVISGNPAQNVWLYCNNSASASRFGVWDCQPGTYRAAMDGIIEFCYIIDGEAEITNLDDGSKRIVKVGDAFVMEPGLRMEWTVKKYVKKYFVISDVIT